jgi:hypothetical protein
MKNRFKEKCPHCYGKYGIKCRWIGIEDVENNEYGYGYLSWCKHNIRIKCLLREKPNGCFHEGCESCNGGYVQWNEVYFVKPPKNISKSYIHIMMLMKNYNISINDTDEELIEKLGFINCKNSIEESERIMRVRLKINDPLFNGAFYIRI